MHRRTPSDCFHMAATCPLLSLYFLCVCRNAFCNLAKPLRKCLKLLQLCKARYTRARSPCNAAKPSRTPARSPCSSAKPSRTRASCSCSLAKPSRTSAGRFCNSAKPVTQDVLSTTQSPLRKCLELLSTAQSLLAVVHEALEYRSKPSCSSARSP